MISLKYIKRVNELPATRLLKEAFEVNRALHTGGHRSYYQKEMSELNIQVLEEIDISQTILDQCTKEIKTQLTSFNDENKLYTNTYSKLYNTYTYQTYITFDVPKSLTRELTKLRISAHDLMIERGRYFRTKLPHDQRL